MHSSSCCSFCGRPMAPSGYPSSDGIRACSERCRRGAWIARGRCGSCGGSRDREDRLDCAGCRRKTSEKIACSRKRRKTNGCCPECGDPKEGVAYLCPGCKQRHKKWDADLRVRKPIVPRSCRQCGATVPGDRRFYCSADCIKKAARDRCLPRKCLSCGDTVEEGRRYCVDCGESRRKESERESGRRLRTSRRERDLCTNCGRPSDGKARCQACREKHNLAQKRHHERSYPEPVTRIMKVLRTGFRRAITRHLAGETTNVFDCLGCTVPELVARLEAQFLLGMTWATWGKEWQIDHIVPLASLRGDPTEENLRRVWHHSNLQPLWSEENRQKGAALPR